MWDYVAKVCGHVLTDRDYRRGYYNEGHLISWDKAVRIADILDKKLESGAVAKYARWHKAKADGLPDVKCAFCHGKGRRVWEGDSPALVALGREPDPDGPMREGQEVKPCKNCEGKGKERPDEACYRFAADNVREFAKFCRASGGFRIQ